MKPLRRPRATIRCGALSLLLLVTGAASAWAQSAVPPAVPVNVPNFWNVERRLERPDAAQLPTAIRFLTTDDFPPFNFVAADGALMGFNLDLARAICAELSATCTIQAVPFAELLADIEENKGDAAIAGLAASPAARQRADFSERYLGTPARFVARRGSVPAEVTPGKVADRTVAVVAGTAHEAYLRDFFKEAGIRPYPDAAAAREALRKGEVDLLFGDGISLSLWLNGTGSDNCCVFAGGPFTESRYFGDGLAVAVKPGNAPLRRALDYALQRVWEKGVYADIYLRWFPIGFY
ncbi:MAG: transporter substrate-binding domain-containing protein [Rhizobiales bacterium]|nr:transporter substrate-binding domain-containing protein [Hyphomicrobiales bacterium]